MLMALSLAEKLGSKNLLSFSLHPGAIMTNLANHLDFAADFAELRKFFSFLFWPSIYMSYSI